MPFPTGLPTKRVHLTVTNPAGGGPATGTVRLTPNVPAIVIDGTAATFTGSGTYRLDAQGRLVDTDGTTLGALLLDNTAPGTAPAGWLWHAIVTTDSGGPRAFYFSLEGVPDEVDLDELQELDPEVPHYVRVPGPTGPAGPTGATGAVGAAGPKGDPGDPAPSRAGVILPVTEHPADTLGMDGDWALSLGERRLYGPKMAGAWEVWSRIDPPTAAGWQRNGFAALSGTDLYLTHAADGFGSGTSWNTSLQPTDGLDVSFTVEMSGGTGADGVTFALAAPATAATFQGGGGGDLGLVGCTAVAVALDTGAGSRARIVTTDATTMTAVATYGGILDLRAVPIRVRVLHLGGTLSVWADSVLLFDQVPVTVSATARVGWTGANGGNNDDHIIRSVQFVAKGGIQL